jgi:hypothetical protein
MMIALTARFWLNRSVSRTNTMATGRKNSPRLKRASTWSRM